MLRNAFVFVAMTGVAGCTMATENRSASLTDRQSKELARALDGKVPGKPVNCVSRLFGTDGLHAVTDDLLLYRVNRSLTYRNDLRGRCSGISRSATMILRPTNNQYCRGDIV